MLVTDCFSFASLPLLPQLCSSHCLLADSSKEKETGLCLFRHGRAALLLLSRPLSPSSLLLSFDNRKSIDRRSFRGGISVARSLIHRLHRRGLFYFLRSSESQSSPRRKFIGWHPSQDRSPSTQ